MAEKDDSPTSSLEQSEPYHCSCIMVEHTDDADQRDVAC